MIGTTLGILTASLLGSAHCAAMCGGFVCVYTGANDPLSGGQQSLLRAHGLYNAGRLVSYLFLGAVAGTVGARVSSLGALVNVAHAATIVAGALMIGWGLSMLLAQRGFRLAGTAAPERWQRLLGALLHRIRQQPVALRAALLGLLTTLLPCGWLYVFVAAAGGTASARDGMLVMAVFWLGTVPALVAVGVGAQRLLGPLRRRLPTLGAVTVLVMGVLALSGRLAMSAAGTTHVH